MFRKLVMVVVVAGALSVALSAAVMAQGTDGRRPTERAGNFNFRVEIEGISQGAFSEVSGLGVKLEVIEYQDGDDLVLRKRPGRAQYPNITLKALPGQPVLDELWEWYQQVLQGNVQRRSGSVIVLDERSSEVARYNFFEAWPAKWEGPSSVDAGGNAVNVEEIQLAVERIERE